MCEAACNLKCLTAHCLNELRHSEPSQLYIIIIIIIVITECTQHVMGQFNRKFGYESKYLAFNIRVEFFQIFDSSNGWELNSYVVSTIRDWNIYDTIYYIETCLTRDSSSAICVTWKKLFCVFRNEFCVKCNATEHSDGELQRWRMCQWAKYTHTYIHTYIHIHTYLHTYIHTYVRTYIHIHTYIHTHTHTHIHTHTHTYIHTYLHTYIHTYIRTYIHIHTYIRTHTHTHIHTYIHTYIHTHTHTYMHTYTHIHTYKHIHTYINTYKHI